MLRRHIFINSDLHLKGDVIFHVTNQNEPIKKSHRQDADGFLHKKRSGWPERVCVIIWPTGKSLT